MALPLFYYIINCKLTYGPHRSHGGAPARRLARGVHFTQAMVRGWETGSQGYGASRDMGSLAAVIQRWSPRVYVCTF